MKFSSLAAPKIVKLTNFNEASGESFVKITIFPFQWNPNDHFYDVVYLPMLLTSVVVPGLDDVTCKMQSKCKVLH